MLSMKTKEDVCDSGKSLPDMGEEKGSDRHLDLVRIRLELLTDVTTYSGTTSVFQSCPSLGSLVLYTFTT